MLSLVTMLGCSLLVPHRDWEYPGVMGHPSNVVSPQDAENYLIFLQDLRAKLPSTARITAATQVWPFADNKGVPMVNVAPFAQVLDWILLMVYDTWGCKFTLHPDGVVVVLIFPSFVQPWTECSAGRRLSQLQSAVCKCSSCCQELDLGRFPCIATHTRHPCLWVHLPVFGNTTSQPPSIRRREWQCGPGYLLT